MIKIVIILIYILLFLIIITLKKKNWIKMIIKILLNQEILKIKKTTKLIC